MAKDVMYLKTLINSEPHRKFVQDQNNFNYNGYIVSLCTVATGELVLADRQRAAADEAKVVVQRAEPIDLDEDAAGADVRAEAVTDLPRLQGAVVDDGEAGGEGLAHDSS